MKTKDLGEFSLCGIRKAGYQAYFYLLFLFSLWYPLVYHGYIYIYWQVFKQVKLSAMGYTRIGPVLGLASCEPLFR
jgi:hypothetical protein